MKKLTELERGIIVKIKTDELSLLKSKSGFLERVNYPESYKEIAFQNEVGRYLFFRFLEEM